jgi:uncharacterized protein involved in response to NO
VIEFKAAHSDICQPLAKQSRAVSSTGDKHAPPIYSIFRATPLTPSGMKSSRSKPPSPSDRAAAAPTQESSDAKIFYQEPFRIFFPAGILLGLAGVSLWPLYYAGLIVAYPATAHARLMIEGFMGSFIIGFLGTAGPRITSTSPFSRAEVVILLTLDLLAAGLHFGESHRAGDALFVCCTSLFILNIGKRFVRRKDSPPPSFVLVALGLLSGMAGAALVGYSETAQYSRAYQFGSALLNEGFVLLPILGVAPFFIRRLLDLPTPDLPESRAFPPQWRRQAAIAAIIGLLIVASFWIDIVNLPRIGSWIRVAAIAFYIATRLPFRGRTFLADCLRIAIFSIFAGFVVLALLPTYRVGALHIVFISGFSFIALAVAVRVVFGHAGRVDLLQKRLPFFIISSVLIFLAMLSRYVADIALKVRPIHLVAAAICWLVAALIWIVRVIPKVTITEPEEEQR